MSHKYKTHKEAIDQISEELGIPKKDVEKYVNGFFKQVFIFMQFHYTIVIRGFGNLTLSSKGRRLRNRRNKLIDIHEKDKHILINAKRRLRKTDVP